MEGQDLHESYLEHSCSIIDKKDVLLTDIPGGGYCNKLRRYWWDLFLVSKDHDKSKAYYTSSHALRVERIRQYRRFGNKVHPFSKLRLFWDCFMLHVFLIQIILFNINTSILYGEMFLPTYFLAAFFELLVILDVVINMQTGYVDPETKRVVLDTMKLMLHYCSTKVFLHVASAIPLQWLMFLRLGSKYWHGLSKCNKFMSALKVWHVFSLLRLYEYSEYWSRERKSFKTTHFLKFLRIVVLEFLTVLIFRDLTDMVLLRMTIYLENTDKYPCPSKVIISKYGSGDNYCCYYVLTITRALRTICLYSFHFAKERNLDKMIITLTGFIITKLFLLWFVFQAYSFISRAKYADDCVIMNKVMTLNMIRRRALPESMAQRVNDFYEFKMARLRVIVQSKNTLFKSLPEFIQQETLLASHSHYLSKISCFADWPPNAMRHIVLMLKQEIYLKNDVVIEAKLMTLQEGGCGEGLCVLACGELAVYSDTEETGHLIDGDHFGELSLVTDKEVTTSTVVAITPCLILFLSKIDFRTFIRQYPELFLNLRNRLEEKQMSGSQNTSTSRSVEY